LGLEKYYTGYFVILQNKSLLQKAHLAVLIPKKGFHVKTMHLYET